VRIVGVLGNEYTVYLTQHVGTFSLLRVGFIIGLIVCSVMMSVVRGAVNTLIVCWADSPSRLEANHPQHTKEMAEAWTSAFPQAGVRRINSNGALTEDIPSSQTASATTFRTYNNNAEV
jgi:hypothetical protein